MAIPAAVEQWAASAMALPDGIAVIGMAGRPQEPLPSKEFARVAKALSELNAGIKAVWVQGVHQHLVTQTGPPPRAIDNEG